MFFKEPRVATTKEERGLRHPETCFEGKVERNGVVSFGRLGAGGELPSVCLEIGIGATEAGTKAAQGWEQRRPLAGPVEPVCGGGF